MAKTILIVDDNRLARMLSKKALTELRPDWTILEAANATEAMETLEQEAVDLMLVDVNMPGESGLELTSRVREAYADMPMALVTANIQQLVRDHGASIGVEVIAKPINAEKLGEWLVSVDA